MEIYILDKDTLETLSVSKPVDYNLNLDEETNGVSTIVLTSLSGAKKGNIVVLNGLYRQFLFIISEVTIDSSSNVITLSCLDISNIFDRKVIERNTNKMTEEGIEKFIADTILENFVNSSDSILNINYIDIYINSNTLATVGTFSQDNLYNLHTFITNCRQYRNINTKFSIVEADSRRLRIDITNETDDTYLIDTTVSEVTNFEKIYEVDPVTKVQAYIRETGEEYNLYLKTNRTTTTDKNDPDRLRGRIEVISCDTLDTAKDEALNTIKANTYTHLIQFSIPKTSKLIDVSSLRIGTPIKIKTSESIYDSYISAIQLSDDNFIHYKTGNLRIDFSDKQRQQAQNGKVGNKIDTTGGTITGSLKVEGILQAENTDIIHVASQTLYDKYEFSTAGYHNLIGAYGDELYERIFNNIPIPNGYKKAFKITAQIYTAAGAEVGVAINNQVILKGKTWSNSDFRVDHSSNFYNSWRDFPEQSVLSYQGKGLNLQAYSNIDQSVGVYNITLHAYFVKI